jgi:hypothetical protein
MLAELMPDEPEVTGLLALMVLIESRRLARTTADGDQVLLAEQDRSRWDAELVAEGQALVRRCLRRGQPGPYQIQAVINAVHSDTAAADQTDWRQILALYDQLVALTPTPVARLNRAVAVGEVAGPAAALQLVDELDLDGYYLLHGIRAELLARLGPQRRGGSCVRVRHRPDRQPGTDPVPEPPAGGVARLGQPPLGPPGRQHDLAAGVPARNPGQCLPRLIQRQHRLYLGAQLAGSHQAPQLLEPMPVDVGSERLASDTALEDGGRALQDDEDRPAAVADRADSPVSSLSAGCIE